MTTTERLRTAVIKMRFYQKEFSRNRNSGALTNAKRYEAEVDKLLEEIRIGVTQTVLLLTFIFITSTTFAQPFIGVGATNSGANFQVGVVAGKVDFTIAYKIPFTREDVPKILSVSVGKQFLLTQKEADNYSITTQVGIAQYTIKEFTAYDANGGDIAQVSTMRMVFGVEVGKDSYMGRMFIHANYVGGLYYGAGIKVFFYR